MQRIEFVPIGGGGGGGTTCQGQGRSLASFQSTSVCVQNAAAAAICDHVRCSWISHWKEKSLLLRASCLQHRGQLLLYSTGEVLSGWRWVHTARHGTANRAALFSCTMWCVYIQTRGAFASHALFPTVSSWTPPPTLSLCFVSLFNRLKAAAVGALIIGETRSASSLQRPGIRRWDQIPGGWTHSLSLCSLQQHVGLDPMIQLFWFIL